MYLVFQLRAPLASFGNSQAEFRTSERVPRKSAVTGLLAAALGIHRGETQAFQTLVDAFSLAVLVAREPRKLTDFHTVQAPVQQVAASRAEQVADIVQKQSSKGGYSGTIVTRREYLQDGHWVCAVEAEAAVAERLKQALEFPHFTLYLGRKSCVLSAQLAPLVVDAPTVEDALTQWAQQTRITLPAQAALHWDRSMTTRATPLANIRRNDVRTRLTHNHFSARDVFQGTAAFAEVA